MKIGALNEKTYKASIKTTVLGKDSAKSEYWHFKDDNSRLYIRMEEEVRIGGEATVNSAIADHEMEGEKLNDTVFDDENEENNFEAEGNNELLTI